MRPDQIALLTDNALSDQARILGVYISEVGLDEPIELSHDDLSRLLYGFPNADTVGRHLRMLILSGYVDKSPGGRGHSDKYLWIARENSRAKNIDLDLARAKTTYPSKIHGLSETVVGSSSKEVVVEEAARVREADLNVENLSPLALKALGDHQELLRGCRGALRDYLLLRVPTDRQYPYVQSLAGWMNGLDPTVWMLPDGAQLDPASRPGMLASALNELLATDERKMKRPEGEPSNLRTKLQVLLRKRGRQPWDGSGMTAAEEQDREDSRREKASRRAMKAAAVEAEREIDEKHHAQELELQEALSWFEGLENGARSTVQQDAETRIQLLVSGGAPRSRMMEEMCLLQAVREARERELEAVA